MKNIFFTTVTLIIFFLFNLSYPQDKWNLELRPGFNNATKSISDAELKTGFGSELTISYRFMPHLAVYAGWSYNNFAAAQSFAGADASFEETGYSFGFQFIHPIEASSLSYLIRLGGTYNHLEIENNLGDIIIDSGHGLGWQIESGLSIALNDNISVMPSLRYRSLSRAIKIETVNTQRT